MSDDYNRSEEIDFNTVIEKGLDGYLIIDVRSESEYALDHIPTAINIPILNNDHRKQVGTTYKQVGSKEAKRLAVKLVSPYLPEFIEKIDTAHLTAPDKQIVIYCWRGGMRSGASAIFTRLAGIHSVRLIGGYATYRKVVYDRLYQDINGLKVITLFGKTGTAKSAILHELENEGYPIIDLEKAAHHKGSLFGDIGEDGYKAVTQKSFETDIWLSLYKNRDAKIFLIEGESAKIGKVTIPPLLHKLMRTSTKVLVEAPIDFRVKFTYNNYAPDKYYDEIKLSLTKIKKYIGNEKYEQYEILLQNNEFEEFTKNLLTEYYDPMYNNAFPKDIDYHIEYGNIKDGTAKILDIYQKELTKNKI